MRRYPLLALAAAAALSVAAYAAPAFADEASTVHFVLSDYANLALPIVALVLLVGVAGALMFGKGLLPPWAQAILNDKTQAYLVTLAAEALNWGVQAVENATKGKELDVDVGNKVIAAAAQSALDNWPKWALDHLGGADGVKKWILKQAEDHGVILPDGGSAATVLASAPVANVGPR